MQLSNKYDQFYATDLHKENIESILVGQWPKNRVEAIIAMGGKGDKVLDIGCGN